MFFRVVKKLSQALSFFLKLQRLTAYALLDKEILSSVISSVLAILLWPPRPYLEEFVRVLLFLLYQSNAVISIYWLISSNLSYHFSNSIKFCKNSLKYIQSTFKNYFLHKMNALLCIQIKSYENIVNISFLWYTLIKIFLKLFLEENKQIL